MPGFEETERLADFVRSTDFEYIFEFSNGYVKDNFTDIWFTVKREVPPASVRSDAPAKTLAQVKYSTGGITFGSSTTQGQVSIPRASTNWEDGDVYADLVGWTTSNKRKVIANLVFRVKGSPNRTLSP